MIVTCIRIPIRASTYCTYGLHAAADHRVDLLSVCTVVEYITGKRRAIHSAAHGTWYVVPVQNAQVFGHDADSLALPPDAAIFLPCLRSVDKRVKLRKTCKGGWDPPVSEAGWRKNRSAQTLSFEAVETLGSPLYSRQQQPATQVDLPTPAYRIASLPVYSHGFAFAYRVPAAHVSTSCVMVIIVTAAI